MNTGTLHPAYLPPGTRVGPWRVVEPRGRGGYGAVYRAESEEDAQLIVALKLALHPWDERFAREAELLTRVQHPAVPRLWDHGQWQNPEGTRCYPYVAMDFVEGLPLYDWARVRRPTSRQVLHLLARLARALEATHAARGVHRDVKGDNVLVRHPDGQAFLMDFGSGHHVVAATLTSQFFPPGTLAYRSPEAWRTVRLGSPAPSEPYAPGPADDVFALGVTAYRMLTARYPLSVEEPLAGHLEDVHNRSPRAHNIRCAPELDALVARMLTPHPGPRGSARELAEALERDARKARPELDIPLFTEGAPRARSVIPAPPRRVVAPPPRVARWPWFAAASLGASLALAVGLNRNASQVAEPTPEPLTQQEHAKDGGTVAVGDSVLTAPVAPVRAPSAWSAITLDMPPRPLPGQARPDANGRCFTRGQVVINGGCWRELKVSDMKDCDEESYVYKRACYTPVFPPPRPATSGTTEGADGG
ncbi:serine/threonine protein kinase [Pyxidicoccus sp. MSG2]|uniref:serine/threonine protein kinase n=1 Tax=Pyxidicoccus sp. MSG2 TaxID=2996790 RepID=UPI0022720499|nr:serine/threonine-protein kinase [Pyxidicoccus sp. MSG2]MCY1020311.1 serine/threonine-protein kinase [Pyxidicoccus sp. MSG2]